jgi:hypothetical protein
VTNVSQARRGLGHPLAIHRDSELPHKAWEHVRDRGLIELFHAHGFEHVDAAGAGYYPPPASLGRRDPRHAAYLTVTAS